MSITGGFFACFNLDMTSKIVILKENGIVNGVVEWLRETSGSESWWKVKSFRLSLYMKRDKMI